MHVSCDLGEGRRCPVVVYLRWRFDVFVCMCVGGTLAYWVAMNFRSNSVSFLSLVLHFLHCFTAIVVVSKKYMKFNWFLFCYELQDQRSGPNYSQWHLAIVNHRWTLAPHRLHAAAHWKSHCAGSMCQRTQRAWSIRAIAGASMWTAPVLSWAVAHWCTMSSNWSNSIATGVVRMARVPSTLSMVCRIRVNCIWCIGTPPSIQHSRRLPSIPMVWPCWVFSWR